MTTLLEEIQKPSNSRQVWVTLCPRVFLNGTWTLYSGNTYWISFTKANIPAGGFSSLKGVAIPVAIGFPDISEPELEDFTRVTDIASLTSHTWTYVESEQRIYVKMDGVENANSFYWALEYEILCSTVAGHFKRDLVSIEEFGINLEEVYYPANISKAPIFKQGFTNQFFGFIQAESTVLELSNADHELDVHLDGVYWNNVRAEVQVCYGEFDYSKIFRYSAIVNGFSADQSTVQFSLRTNVTVLDNQIDVPKCVDIFGIQDPNQVGWRLRIMYGRARGLLPWNYNYNATPGTSANRQWVISKDRYEDLASFSQTVLSGTSSTTTVANAKGICRGDIVRIVDNGVAIYDVRVLDVNYTTNVITHSGIGARTVVGGDTISRPFIGRITIVDSDGVNYHLSPFRDFSVTNFTDLNGESRAGFTLVNNFEAAVSGFPTPFDPSIHTILVSAYGRVTVPTFTSPTADWAVSPEGGAVAKPAVVAASLISEAGSLFALSVDEDSFLEAAELDDIVGFAIPNRPTDSRPTYKEVLNTVLNSGMLRMGFKDNYSTGSRLLAIFPVQPTKSTADFQVDASEMTLKDFRMDCEDMFSQLVILHTVMDSKQTFGSDVYDYSMGTEDADVSFVDFNESEIAFQYQRFNSISKYGAGISKEFVLRTYLWSPDDIYNDLDIYRLQLFRFYLSERKAAYTIQAKNRLLGANIGDTVELIRSTIFGSEKNTDTLNTKKLIVVESQKSIDGVTLVLDDQKGVEDHAGSWP